MAQVRRFGIWQTSKFMAVMYFFLSMVIVLPMGLIMVIAGASLGDKTGFAVGGVIFFLLPIAYAVAAFVMTVIGCFIYNIVAAMVGGVEVELE